MKLYTEFIVLLDYFNEKKILKLIRQQKYRTEIHIT